MRIRIIALGRARAGPEKSLVETYAGRLTWPCEIVELEAKKGLEGAALVSAEAALIDKALQKGTGGQRAVIALDERGQVFGSREFARRLGALANQGYAEIVFVIGGADGLAPAIRDRADLLLAFGAMTWPHMLVRVLLMEQIYRAQTILAGHPYHRD
ncbi:23S rRNA (pseudouridine1915-N3)-methyltransferase [Dongia mobilis]|uniref:Ribosomal RNA large subunit methyltransferase H n=1 Tax=Dongia mobilis TaxID=578943 RepID=A0A4R6WUB5_9PROT|nr:23S rRNA (pseudouridine(1915)-N(3))-methyltransferase RlmH [Dongia mobilis]TDQ83989.1 23S rRNA (pseudouridine1915-N3)-methyltransferase [Dongia mobilis]